MANQANQDKQTAPQELSFFPLGTGEQPYGVKAAVDEAKQEIHLVSGYGPDAIAKASPSSTGKTKLIGNTGGRCSVPGSPVAVNVLAMVPNKPMDGGTGGTGAKLE